MLRTSVADQADDAVPSYSNYDNCTGPDTSNHESLSDITQFFDDRSIFITGATGFVGKALIEKILRSCPSVKAVYILVRPKLRANIDARLIELFSNSLFNNIKRDNPAILSKVIPIEGDIRHEGLGICNDDQRKLVDEVSVVIHSAATVKFNEKLRMSIELNVNGTKRIIELCKQMKQLQALIHVSTAYANCDRSQIREVVYPLSSNPGKLMERLERMSDAMLESAAADLIENRPNTYTFTKAMAECLLNEERDILPISIVRPSIVTATWKEPVPGWVDNVSGLTGFIAAWGKGVLRTAEVHGNKVVDLIPVDTLVNLILAAACETGASGSRALRVYNCCSGNQNPVRWGEVAKVCNESLVKHPFDGTFWYPSLCLVSNPVWTRVNDILLHYVPARLMDLGAILSGGKRQGLRVYHSLRKALSTIQFFTTHEWSFPSDNVTALHQKLSTKDQALFNFSVKELDWSSYLEKYCLGVRENILGQDISTIPAAKNRIRKMYWTQQLIQFLCFLLISNILLHILSA